MITALPAVFAIERASGAGPPEQVRRAIADELSEAKYRLGVPWWTRVVESLERWWIRFVEWVTAISERVGGPLVMALLVGMLLVVTAAVVTSNLGRRRARLVDARIRREHEAARGLDPADLERRATTAEEAGDMAGALRLLFRAALIRLDREGMIDLRPGTTTGTVVESLESADFATMAARFDAVIYGGKPATPDDPGAMRAVTRSLLTGARR